MTFRIHSTWNEKQKFKEFTTGSIQGRWEEIKQKLHDQSNPPL